MLWLNRHRRFLDRLSAYIDRELSPGQVGALEAHLASCSACRRHLQELQATVLALRDLPHAQAPRSFALTPEQAARPAAPPPPPRPAALSTGVRLTAASLALVLAAVLVVDLGDLGGGNGGGAGNQAAPLGFMNESERAPLGAADAAQPYATAFPSALEGDGQPAQAPAPQATGLPQPTGAPKEAATPSPAPTLLDRAVAQSPAPEQAAPALQPSGEGGGGGIDALRAAEIALAVALGLTIGGTVALALAGTRR